MIEEGFALAGTERLAGDPAGDVAGSDASSLALLCQGQHAPGSLSRRRDPRALSEGGDAGRCERSSVLGNVGSSRREMRCFLIGGGNAQVAWYRMRGRPDRWLC